MKTTALAAIAALLAVARVATADTTGSVPSVQAEAARAAVEAHALVATMQTNAAYARQTLEIARRAGRRDEIRCANEALSRADVALRDARDEATVMAYASRAGDLPSLRRAIAQVRERATASHQARVLAVTCGAPVAVSSEHTAVVVHVDPRIAQIDPHVF